MIIPRCFIDSAIVRVRSFGTAFFCVPKCICLVLQSLKKKYS